MIFGIAVLLGVLEEHHADARLDDEHVAPDDRTVRRQRMVVGHLADELAGVAELLGLDARLDAVEALQRQHDVFQRRIARAFADARDGHVGHFGAGGDGGQRVGRAQAEVHVHVRFDRECRGNAASPSR